MGTLDAALEYRQLEMRSLQAQAWIRAGFSLEATQAWARAEARPDDLGPVRELITPVVAGTRVRGRSALERLTEENWTVHHIVGIWQRAGLL